MMSDEDMRSWPEWWNHELLISPHVVERMKERDFTEIDLRTMLKDAEGYRESPATGRFIIASRLSEQTWEIIVEPDEHDRILIVVTAYRLE